MASWVAKVLEVRKAKALGVAPRCAVAAFGSTQSNGALNSHRT